MDSPKRPIALERIEGMIMSKSYRLVAAFAAVGSLLLAHAPTAGAADGPYASAGYAFTDYRTRCNGACDRTDQGFRVAAGWGFLESFAVEAVYLDAGRFIASDITAGAAPFKGSAKVTLW